MAKLTVIANRSLALGVRLAGVDVVVADDRASAQRALVQLMDEGDAGIIAVEAPYLEEMDYATVRRIDSTVKPVVVSLPTGADVLPEQRRSRQIAELIRRAIGVRMTFHGNGE